MTSTIIDFNTAFSNAETVTIDGFTFDAAGNSQIRHFPNYAYTRSTSITIMESEGDGVFLLNGIQAGSFSTAQVTATATLTDGTTQSLTTSGTIIGGVEALDFGGLEVVSLVISSNDGLVSIDNFEFGSNAEILPPDAPVVLGLTNDTDTGLADDDDITNNASPTVEGTAEADSTVTILAGGVEAGTTSADSEGNFTFDLSGLAEGDNEITATASNDGGASEASTVLTIEVDTMAPGAPAITSTMATTDNTPTVTGTAEAGSLVTVSFGDGIEATATADVSGNWSATAPQALDDGTRQISATAQDVAGNVSDASADFSLTIDTTPPAVPGDLDLVAGSDTGVSDSDDLTSNDTVTITGTADTDSIVNIIVNDVNVATVTADDAGDFVYVASLAEGENEILAFANDDLGNSSESSEALTVTVDTTAPDAPNSLAVQADDDGGASDNDGITTETSPLIEGFGEAGSTVEIFSDVDGLVGTVALADSGTVAGFSVELDELSEGEHTLTAVATDAAGNTSEASQGLVVDVDLTAPDAPAITGLTQQSDLGISDTDGLTSDVTPTFSGTGEPGATVEVVSNIDGVLGTAVVNGAGEWLFTADPLTGGDHEITATQTDAAGNGSEASAAFNFTLDSTQPTVVSVDVDTPTGDLVITFSEDVFTQNLGDADFRILVADGDEFRVVEEISIDGFVNASGNQVTVSRSVELERGVDYVVTLGGTSGRVTADLAGNPNVQVTSPGPLSFSIPVEPSNLALASESDTGQSSSDGVTNDNTPVITGVGPAFASLVAMSGEDEVGFGVTNGSGNFSLEVSQPLADGEHSITVVALTSDGDIVSPDALEITVDTQAPDAPSAPVAIDNPFLGDFDDEFLGPIPLEVQGPGGLGNGEFPLLEEIFFNFENSYYNMYQFFGGTAEPGAKITLTGTGATEGELTYYTFADFETGEYAAEVFLNQGFTSITATATDLAGNVSEVSTATEILVNNAPVGQDDAFELNEGDEVRGDLIGAEVLDMVLDEYFGEFFRFGPKIGNSITALSFDDEIGDSFVILEDSRGFEEPNPEELAELEELLQGVDYDFDFDELSVVAINGDDEVIGRNIVLDSGARLRVNADGTFVYDTENRLDRLNDGDELVDSVTYTISDGFETATATVEFTVNGITPVIIGTAGGETLTGTAGDDVVRGDAEDTDNGGAGGGEQGADTFETRGGDDTVFAGTNDDIVTAGSGDDLVNAAAGNDEVNGNNGDDRINGGAGDDTLGGGNGDDVIRGEAGNDDISGGRGADRLFGGDGEDDIGGGNGNDFIRGGSGNDVVDGAAGKDTVHGGDGNDTVRGSGGIDELNGGGGDDRLFGGNNGDMLRGGGGDDRLTGGNGADVFLLTLGSGDDVITDFNANTEVLDFTDHTGVTGLAGLQISDDERGFAVVSDQMGGSTTLLGVSADNLDSDNFAFSDNLLS